jgi:hypothetical protein
LAPFAPHLLAPLAPRLNPARLNKRRPAFAGLFLLPEWLSAQQREIAQESSGQSCFPYLVFAARCIA